MEEIRDSVLKCLYDYPDKDDHLIVALNGIIERHGRKAYPVILHVLTHLDLEPQTAEKCWHQIISHLDTLSDALDRRISLRTALCDYFCSINRSLKNPIMIEIHIFEATAKSSKFDSLTGLYSRGYFDSALEREFSRAKRYNTDLSVLFFDLDNFKKINDVFGHAAGDMVLKNVARIIREEIRSEDTAARYGGEEFILVLPETRKSPTLIPGERIRKKVEALNLRHDGRSIPITISGGLATYPIDAKDPIKLMQCADQALYSAKHSGKNNIAFYSQDKRRHHRTDFAGKIKVREIGFQETKDFTAVSKNLSISGIRFESETPLAVGARVQLHIPMNSSASPVFTLGTVVQANPSDNGRHGIGVSFLDIEKRGVEQINKLVH